MFSKSPFHTSTMNNKTVISPVCSCVRNVINCKIFRLGSGSAHVLIQLRFLGTVSSVLDNINIINIELFFRTLNTNSLNMCPTEIWRNV